MDGQVSATPNRRRACNSSHYPDAEKRHYGRWTGDCQRPGNSPRVDTISPAVEYLPSLCAGFVVQPARVQAKSGQSVPFSFCGRFSGLLSVQRRCGKFPTASGGPTRKIWATVVKGKDSLYRIRAVCTRERIQARRETKGVYLFRIHALLRENKRGILQSQTSHQPKEVGPKLVQVHGLGKASPSRT